MPEKNAAAKSPKAKPAKPKSPKKEEASAKDAAPAPVSVRGTCTAEKCKFPLRAKGYCRKHFMAWRRGKLGAHHQYKICTKEACRKQRAHGSLCAEHAGKGTPADAAAAAAAT